MYKYVLLVLFVSCGITVSAQPYSNKTVVVGDHTYLPYVKGKFVNRVAPNDVIWKKIVAIFESNANVPQGYEIEAYSDDNGMLEVSYMPYELEDGEQMRMSGSSVSLYANHPTSIFKQPLQPGIDDIYTAPVKTADFMGYPVYEHEGEEVTVLYKGNVPLFVPVSKEEYLQALIRKEEREKSTTANVSIDESLKEMEKAYQELLKVDKAAAEEFKKEMKNFEKEMKGVEKEMKDFQKEMTQSEGMVDLATSYKKELARLSPAERKKQAYYSMYVMEKPGSLSGLVAGNETEDAQPLVKPNYKAISKNPNGSLSLLVVQWKLGSSENRYSPRLYRSQGVANTLVDDKLAELYLNQAVWRKVIELVK